MAKKMLVKGQYEIRVDEKGMLLKANRMGAFEGVSRNFNGNRYYCSNLTEMKMMWDRLVELGYSVEEMPVSAPKQSLFTMKFVDDNGKEISGRSIYAKEKSRRKAEYVKANNYFKGVTGEALRKYMEIIEQKVKDEMKVWEAEYLSQF